MIRRLIKIIGFSFSIIGAFSAVVTLLPRVSVSPPSPEASNISPTFFLISNSGIVPLTNVEPSVGLCKLKFSDIANMPVLVGAGCRPGGPIATFMKPTIWARSDLGLDEHYTIALQDFLHLQSPAPIDYADISISVDYQVWMMPWHFNKSFRFKTKPGGDGKIYWYAE